MYPLKPKPEVAERLVFMENAVRAVTVQIQVLEEFRNFLNVPKEIWLGAVFVLRHQVLMPEYLSGTTSTTTTDSELHNLPTRALGSLHSS
jgi:hypothetical protein